MKKFLAIQAAALMVASTVNAANFDDNGYEVEEKDADRSRDAYGIQWFQMYLFELFSFERDLENAFVSDLSKHQDEVDERTIVGEHGRDACA